MPNKYIGHIIIPQHREALNSRNREKQKIIKPVLDDQKLEIICAEIGQSYSNKVEVTLVLFDANHDKDVTGIIVGLDQQNRRVKMCNNDKVI